MKKLFLLAALGLLLACTQIIESKRIYLFFFKEGTKNFSEYIIHRDPLDNLLKELKLKDNDDFIGCADFTIGEKKCYIDRLFIKSKYRKQDLSKRLMSYVAFYCYKMYPLKILQWESHIFGRDKSMSQDNLDTLYVKMGAKLDRITDSDHQVFTFDINITPLKKWFDSIDFNNDKMLKDIIIKVYEDGKLISPQVPKSKL